MKEVKFNINEITTIVMAEIEEKENFELWGIEEEVYLPKPIEEKINLLTKEELNNFYENISLVAEEVYQLKSGELNMLNKLREEIIILSQEYLKEYIKK